ncbi:glycosyl transferase 2 family protein, partial [Yersinia pestis PY-54]
MREQFRIPYLLWRNKPIW